MRALPSARANRHDGRPEVLLVLIIRSVAFNVLFYLNLIIQLLAALPTLIMPRGAILAVARFWARSR